MASKKAYVVTTLSLLLAASTFNAMAEDKPLTKEDVQGIIKEYILDHPEVMMESFEKKQKKEAEDRQKNAKDNIAKHKDEIFKNPMSPVVGSSKPDVEVVEFFDYNCGYCKRVLPTVSEILKNDKNVRFIFKELPILGPTSELAAKYAIAVFKVDKSKYFDFHTELMNMTGEKTEDSLQELAKKIGLKADKVKEAANSKEVSDYIAAERKLAGEINVQGTPAFIVGEEFIPGAVDKTTLENLIKKTREAKK